jgi:hypothetical protein
MQTEGEFAAVKELQGLKPGLIKAACGTTEVVPCYKEVPGWTTKPLRVHGA